MPETQTSEQPQGSYLSVTPEGIEITAKKGFSVDRSLNLRDPLGKVIEFSGLEEEVLKDVSVKSFIPREQFDDKLYAILLEKYSIQPAGPAPQEIEKTETAEPAGASYQLPGPVEELVVAGDTLRDAAEKPAEEPAQYAIPATATYSEVVSLMVNAIKEEVGSDRYKGENNRGNCQGIMYVLTKETEKGTESAEYISSFGEPNNAVLKRLLANLTYKIMEVCGDEGFPVYTLSKKAITSKIVNQRVFERLESKLMPDNAGKITSAVGALYGLADKLFFDEEVIVSKGDLEPFKLLREKLDILNQKVEEDNTAFNDAEYNYVWKDRRKELIKRIEHPASVGMDARTLGIFKDPIRKALAHYIKMGDLDLAENVLDVMVDKIDQSVIFGRVRKENHLHGIEDEINDVDNLIPNIANNDIFKAANDLSAVLSQLNMFANPEDIVAIALHTTGPLVTRKDDDGHAVQIVYRSGEGMRLETMPLSLHEINSVEDALLYTPPEPKSEPEKIEVINGNVLDIKPEELDREGLTAFFLPLEKGAKLTPINSLPPEEAKELMEMVTSAENGEENA